MSNQKSSVYQPPSRRKFNKFESINSEMKQARDKFREGKVKFSEVEEHLNKAKESYENIIKDLGIQNDPKILSTTYIKFARFLLERRKLFSRNAENEAQKNNHEESARCKKEAESCLKRAIETSNKVNKGNIKGKLGDLDKYAKLQFDLAVHFHKVGDEEKSKPHKKEALDGVKQYILSDRNINGTQILSNIGIRVDNNRGRGSYGSYNRSRNKRFNNNRPKDLSGSINALGFLYQIYLLDNDYTKVDKVADQLVKITSETVNDDQLMAKRCKMRAVVARYCDNKVSKNEAVKCVEEFENVTFNLIDKYKEGDSKKTLENNLTALMHSYYNLDAGKDKDATKEELESLKPHFKKLGIDGWYEYFKDKIDRDDLPLHQYLPKKNSPYEEHKGESKQENDQSPDKNLKAANLEPALPSKGENIDNTK